MRSTWKLPARGIVVALSAAVLAAGCIPTLRHRPTHSLPTTAWLKSGKQSRPTAAMRKLARSLRGADDLETIRRIFGWVYSKRVPFRGYKPRVLRRRTAAALFKARTYSGCGDWGLLLASLFRAAGLPTVFVEAVQKDWAQARQAKSRVRGYRGHVFLEVHTSKGWVVVDSTKPYLWQKYDPKEKNLPRGYYVMAKGYDPWDIGIHNKFQLHWVMDRFVENTPGSRFKDVILPKEPLLRRLVFITSKEVANGLRHTFRGVELIVLGPQLVQRWLDRCKKCEAVALLPADLSADRVKAFYLAVGGKRRLGPYSELVKSTPRLLALPGVKICVYVRRSSAELVRHGRKHGRGPINESTCGSPAP